jgi:hypothetical protein
MEWRHTHKKGEVKECIFHDWADTGFKAKWEALKNRGAKSYDELKNIAYKIADAWESERRAAE